ncbi:hypothetical protein OUO20_16040 [Arthrobacter sp. FX8]|uniref:hypothetical protein n=1 Tax=Arthrobacter sp. FX8 TaxID=2997335 RepID=UPI00227CB0BF|nr:hypothetical protein [Arthrobacter sp. FX8]WAJ32616.1 hypothetical protein OUO20_16040 [Arthrobacter sp. FX8]
MRHCHYQHAQFINGKRVVAAVIGTKLPTAGLRKSAKQREISGCVNLRQSQQNFLARDVSVHTPEVLHITVRLCLIMAAEP